MTTLPKIPVLVLGALLVASNAAAQGSMPISGKPVPEFAALDAVIRAFLVEHDIRACTVGVMKDGKIVYQRGFGWKDANQTVPLRHDALMRVASVTKPMTAAVVQKRIAEGSLSGGEFIFDADQPVPGVLDLPPIGPEVEPRYADITVQHCLEHRGGWNRDASSPPFDSTIHDVLIAADLAWMGVTSPVEREIKARWMQGFPLAYAPGEFELDDEGNPVLTKAYSNEGFMMLGLVAEAVDGRDIDVQIREDVFAPLPWCPLTEVIKGRTVETEQSPREPNYDSAEVPLLPNVMAPPHLPIASPYGGWSQEAAVGHGGMVASTTALLNYAEHYYFDTFTTIAEYGKPRNGGARNDGVHNGLLPGTESILRQRADGVNYAATMNKYNWGVVGQLVFGQAFDSIFAEGLPSTNWYSILLDGKIDQALAGITDWPTQAVDGEWADFAEPVPGPGTYEDPYSNFGVALSVTPEEGSLNCKPSTSSWTGTIDKRMRIRAHGGSVVIGE